MIRLNAEREAGREDDRARHQRDKGVERADTDCFAGKRVALRGVAAEDLHSGNAEAQGEKCLIHGACDDGAKTVFLHALCSRKQIELHTLGCAGKREAVNSQNEDQRKQRKHHALGNALQTVLKTEATDKEACNHDDLRPERHSSGLGKHASKHAAGRRGVHSGMERADEELSEVADHPARDSGVIHHQHHAAEQAEPAVNVPLRALGLQRFISKHSAFFAGASDGKLHRQNRNAHDQQADQIDQHEQTAAIQTGDIRETPDIADADGAACAYEQESQTGTK